MKNEFVQIAPEKEKIEVEAYRQIVDTLANVWALSGPRREKLYGVDGRGTAKPVAGNRGEVSGGKPADEEVGGG